MSKSKKKENESVLPQVALGLAILALVVAVVSFAEVNSERTKQCSVLGVDMVTQKVTLECK